MKLSGLALIVLFGFGAAFGQKPTQDPANLVVSISGRGPLYFEGAYSFFQVRSKGALVEQKRLNGKSMSFSLPAGDYELVSFVRPCDGNCGLLDPPEDECRGTFSLKPKETLYAVRQQTSEGPCTLMFSSKPQN